MCFFVFKQKTAYEVRISDWSSDVCSSDLVVYHATYEKALVSCGTLTFFRPDPDRYFVIRNDMVVLPRNVSPHLYEKRSEEHTSELQSLMRISYAVFCLKKKNYHINEWKPTTTIYRYTA